MADRSLMLGPYAAVFAPLSAEGRAEAVARRLGEAIGFGLIPDGSMLPAESDLAERFGVATTTVRQALGVLRNDGLIATRRGRGGGSFVQAPADGGRAALASRLRQITVGDLRDMSDLYAAISGTAARLAALRADTDDIARLRRIAMTRVEQSDRHQAGRNEGNFHLELAASAQSARLTRQELMLQGEFGALLWLAHFEWGGSGSDRRHVQIVEAVAARDGDAARAAAEDHAHDIFRAAAHLHEQTRRTMAR